MRETKMTRITDTERVLVSAAKDGKTFFVWHKCEGTGNNNEPHYVSKEKLADKIEELLIKAGKIIVE